MSLVIKAHEDMEEWNSREYQEAKPTNTGPGVKEVGKWQAPP